MTPNFSYLIPGKLAGSGRIGRGERLADDLTRLARRKIRAVVSLTEEPPDVAAMEKRGFRVLHLPVRDFSAPGLDQIRRFVEFVDACLAEGMPVLVHCGAGLGRTGVMLASYLIHQGHDPAEAIRRVREARPGSIETLEQEEILFRYHRQTAKPE